MNLKAICKCPNEKILKAVGEAIVGDHCLNGLANLSLFLSGCGYLTDADRAWILEVFYPKKENVQEYHSLELSIAV